MPTNVGLEALAEIIEALPEGLAFQSSEGGPGFSNHAWRAYGLPSPGSLSRLVEFSPQAEAGRGLAQLAGVELERRTLASGQLMIARPRMVGADKAEQAMQRLIGDSLAKDDPLELIRSATAVVAATTGLRWVVASRFLDNGAVEALAVLEHGRSQREFSYHLYGSPCHAVVGAQGVCFFNDVPLEFPNERALIALGVRSYLGVVYRSHDRPLGHFFVMHDQPLTELRRAEIESTLRLVALFVGARLELLQTSEQLQAERSTARTDALTGLLNRRALDQDLSTANALHRAGKLQDALVVFLDVDGLKKVNDQLGHAEGDRLLSELARILRVSLRSDDLCYRIGGDEFAVLVTAMASDAEVWARRARLWEGELHRAGFAQAGISAGIAALTEASDAHRWLQLADQRMYANKRMRRA